MPSRRQVREEQGKAISPQVKEEAEVLVGYQRWEFHPTKQFVRRRGWLDPVQAFLQSRAEAGLGATWKYLTLPGKDALDVGLFYREGLLARYDDGWPTLAICDRDFGTQVVNKIGLPMLGWDSKRIEDLIYEPNHPVTRNFPYEVINLDFCGPLFLQKGRRLDVLARLVALQRLFALQRRCAFLLLLTTQDSLGKFSRTARDMMMEFLQSNIADSEEFRHQYETAFGSDDPQACFQDFVRFAQLIVPKTVADCARAWGCEVEELFAASYLRQDQSAQGYRMICHTFRIDPVSCSGSAKYEPDPRLSRLRAHPPLSQMLSSLSSEEREMADASYSHFIAGLLTRNPIDVSYEVENDEDLRKELATDAEGLSMWWEKQ